LTVFSQTDSSKYPKTVIINKDTVTQFYMWQAKELAKDVSLKKYYRDVYFLTEKQLQECTLINVNKDSINSIQIEKLNIQNTMLNFKDSIIITKELVINSQASIIKSQNKKAKSKKVRNWVLAVAGIVATEELFRNIYKNK